MSRYDEFPDDDVLCGHCEEPVEDSGNRKREHKAWCPDHPDYKPECDACENPADLVKRGDENLCKSCLLDREIEEMENVLWAA